MPDRDGIEGPFSGSRTFRCAECETWLLPSAVEEHRRTCGPRWRERVKGVTGKDWETAPRPRRPPEKINRGALAKMLDTLRKIRIP